MKSLHISFSMYCVLRPLGLFQIRPVCEMYKRVTDKYVDYLDYLGDYCIKFYYSDNDTHVQCTVFTFVKESK